MRHCLLLFALPWLAAATEAVNPYVSLGSMTIDVRDPDRGVPERLRARPLAGEGDVALVKLPGPVTAEQRAALSRVTQAVYAYLPHDSFLVRLSRGGAAEIAAAVGAAYVGPYHPAYKIPERVLASSVAGEGLQIVMVHLFPDADLAGTVEVIERLGVGVVGQGRTRRFSRIRMLLPPSELARVHEAIARLPEVFWIDVEPRLSLVNDTTIWVGQSGVGGGQATPVFNHGIYGTGQVVGIIDTGLDADMCWFYDAARGLPPTNACNGGTTIDSQQRKVLAVDFLHQSECNGGIGAGEWDTHDHGSHVAGTVGGDRGTPLIHDGADGMAPGAKLVIQDGGFATDNCADLPGLGCPVVDLYPIFQQAYTQGARLHTNSYGDNENSSVQNDYTAASQDVDEFMWDHKDFLVFFAAGNSGPGNDTVGSPSTAKSCVSVGATERGSTAEFMAFFSSCGYTDDNRYKPEVTIPGANIVSANNDGNVGTSNCGTTTMSGTSMASPAAAGLAALIGEYYAAGWYPTGVAVPADAFTPSAALVRATLVNSAQNMTGAGSPIPSRCQGWGRILLDNALFFQGDARKIFVDDASSFPTGSTSQLTYTVQVLSSSVPFKATVAWTDYPSTPASFPHLVNDVDLTVTAPGGTVYTGNVFSGGQSTTGGSADRRNTLEQVLRLTPTPGTYTVTVRAQAIPSGPQPFALVVTGDLLACPSIAVDPPSLPAATVGTSYSQTLTASGGTAPYTFAVTTGTLPTGLTLGATTGVISGTPTAAGSFPFTVTATDAAGCTGSRGYTIDASCPSVAVDPPSLPAGTVGSPYSQTVVASGGTAPYSYAVTSGTLPAGLALGASSGVISGTPTAVGSSSFTVTAADTYGCTGSRAYTIVVSCPAIGVDPPSLPGGTAGTPYSQTVAGSGGTAPYAYAIVSGGLPPGLALGAGTGVISGTPTTTGSFPFTVSATDAFGCAGSRAYAIAVGCPTVDLSPATLPAATEGSAYNQTVTASGGTAPYAYAVTSGALPPGLALDAASGEIAGVPASPGTFTFTVTATDSLGCSGSRAYDLLVNPVGCSTITVTPATLPGTSQGLAYQQTIVATGGQPPYTYALTAGALPAGLTLGAATGELSGVPTTAGSFSFTIGATDGDGCSGSRAYDVDVAIAVDHVVGEGLGPSRGNLVRVYTRAGTPTAVQYAAYGAGRWGTNVAAGELDSVSGGEILTGPGPGDIHGPHVRGWRRDGSSMAKVSFYAYGTLRFGANVTAGDLDGDPFAEIGTGAGPGEVFGPHVRGFDYDDASLSPIAKVNFFAYSTLRYGVNLAAGSIDADPFAEIVTGAGPSAAFGATVRGFDYDATVLRAITKINFAAFPTMFGVNVATGDLDVDGIREIAAAQGPGAANANRFLSFDYDGAAIAQLPGSDLTPGATLYGGRVASGDLSGDGRDELLCGEGRDPAADTTVRGYEYAGALTPYGPQFAPFAPPGYGVNVASGALAYY